MAIYTHQEAIDLIKARCDAVGGRAKMADALGVSSAYLSAVISGNKPIGPKITSYFGLEPMTIYKTVEEER